MTSIFMKRLRFRRQLGVRNADSRGAKLGEMRELFTEEIVTCVEKVQ